MLDARKLRPTFYAYLKSVAYKTPIGWILFDDVTSDEMKPLNDLLKQLEVITGRKEIAQIYTVLIPKQSLIKWIDNYIQEVHVEISELVNKIDRNEVKENTKRKYKSRIKTLKAIIARLKLYKDTLS